MKLFTTGDVWLHLSPYTVTAFLGFVCLFVLQLNVARKKKNPKNPADLPHFKFMTMNLRSLILSGTHAVFLACPFFFLKIILHFVFSLKTPQPPYLIVTLLHI